MKKIVLFIILFASNVSYSQILTYDKLMLSANADVYYAKNSYGKYIYEYYNYYNNLIVDDYLNSYNYTTPIEDKIRLYNASLTADYVSDDIKGKLTVGYGDLEDEIRGTPQYIREANLGFSPVKDLWLEAGIFFRPFSAEKLLPSENFLTSTSILSGIEPLRLEAAKVEYNFTDNFSAAAWVSEGYGIYEDVYKNKSFGFSLGYSPFNNLNIKFNNLTGNVYWIYIEQWEPYIDYRTQKVMRYFNNLTISYNYKNKLELLSEFAFIVQDDSRLFTFDKAVATYGGFISGRYNISNKFSVSARGEYFYDRHGLFSLFSLPYSEYGQFFIPSGIEEGAFAVGFEYRPRKQLYARLEMNYMQIYQKLGIPARDYFSKFTGIASMGIDF